MRIQKVEIAGFKSFPEPTVLEFSDGVSGIVGPNGCGKSNIVDALRWVIGEQSPRRLRAKEMEDVLFNGTRHPDGSARRGPVGMAEVSLVLTNEDPPVGEGPEVPEIWKSLRDVPEIVVTRRYFRPGESEYLINRRPCRLKDITELFMGTGVGTRAYSVVEQGQIDDIVKARPENLRLFVEEAAGTTLYRSRRLTAERKLERTRDALSRVMDILREKDRQIGWLRRMAKRAEEFRLVQQELRAVELDLGRRRLEELNERLASEEEARSRAEEKRQTLGRSVSELEAGRERDRQRLAAIEDELRERQERLLEFRTGRERAEAHLDMLHREAEDAKSRHQQLAEERGRTERRVRELRDEVLRREALLSQADGQRADGEERLRLGLATLQQQETAIAALARELDEARTEIVENRQREAELKNRLAALESRIGEREERKRAVVAEIEDLGRRLAMLLEGQSQLVASIRRLKERREESERALGETQDALEARAGELEELDRLRAGRAEAMAETRSRLETAEELVRDYGRYEEGVRAVMRNHPAGRNGVLDLVAEVIDTDPEYETAVAAVLGERLQHVVVRRPEDARAVIEELKSVDAGRASFVPVEPREAGLYASDLATHSPGEGALANLLDVVRVREEYGNLARYLLSGAVLVESLERGIALWRRNGQRLTLVTPSGEVVFPDGVIRGGSGKVQGEKLLAQRREVQALRDEVRGLEEDLAALDDRRATARRERDDLRSHVASLNDTVRSLSMEELSAAKDRERFVEAMQDVEASRGRAREETVRLAQEIDHHARELETVRVALAEEEGTRREGESRRQVIEDRLARQRADLESQTARTTELRVTVAQEKEKEESLRESLRAACERIEEEEDRLRRLAVEADSLGRREKDRNDEREALLETVTENRSREASEEKAFSEVRRSASELRDRIEECERELGRHREEIEGLRNEQSRRDVTLTELRIERDHLVERIGEQWGVGLEDVVPGETPRAELELRCQELRRRVERLDRSSVGLAAADELEALESERETLSRQKEDLEHSVADLQKTISILNRESRTRFADTFAAVNERFQRAFPQLFGGGRGRLVLTDENDLLETGVEVQAQPPGMAVRTLSLLSGGQRSLTAVALIFALLQYRPSPFCILDEVDHALDDANIDRFRGILEEMSGRSQFLVITHNKRTMECADALYGVTMDEPGVSRVVSVRLQRAA